MNEQNTTDLEFEQLEKLVKSKKTVKIYLRNGYQMNAVIEKFDSNVIIVTANNKRMMLYRQNLSSIDLE